MKDIKRRRILVIGSTNIDYVTRTERLPVLGESVTDGVFKQTFGGKGSNQAFAAARSSLPADKGGCGADFMTALGTDASSIELFRLMGESGLGTDLVDRKPDYTTGTALIMIDAQGHNYLSVAPGANYTITAERIRAVKDRIAAAAMVLVQYEIPRDALVEILTIAGRAGVPRVFNFAPARDFSFDASTIPEYLIVNEVEFQQLFGADPERLLPKPASAGPASAGAASASQAQPRTVPAPELLPLAKDFPLVLVTLGAAGVAVFRRGVPGERYAALPAKPVDTTGAGDTFCGAFTVAVSEGKDLAAAIRFGQGAAALSVQVFGALPSVPFRKDIDRYLEEHR